MVLYIVLWLTSTAYAQAQPSPPAHGTTLALNRALGVECTHCHVENQWKDASKPAFETARKMSLMVDVVNKQLGDLGPITCVTCHGGQRRPARQPGSALDEQLARWPSALADAPESLKIGMAVYNVALGVGCDHCHSADWKAKDKAPMKKVALMSSLFEEFPKYMPATARTQCFMCHKGSTRPVKQVATAQLTGKVVDRLGLALPGATVTLAPPAPASPTKTVTNTSGHYEFTNATPGTYTVSFELAGFLTYSRARLALTAGQVQTLTVALDTAPLAIPPISARPPTPSTTPPGDPKFTVGEGEVTVGVETSLGTFYLAIDTRRAPITAANFLKYVDAKLYDSGRFHRATRPDNYTPAPPNRPMMNIIQGGINPARRSEGFPAIPLERTSVTGITHVTGVVSMARGTADSATSDFFVLLDDQPSLDFGGLRFDDAQGGAAFGHVLAGLDVVKKIQQQPVDGQNLSGPVTIRRVWRLK